MNESSVNQSRGRGRARGKELTPHERVTQWVNQREARRLNKLRWSGKDPVDISSEVVIKDRKDDSQDHTVADESIQTDRPKRTQNVQLYIPPSLRGKKSLSEFDMNPTASQHHAIEEMSSNASEDDWNSSKPNISPQPSSRGRGRGKSKRKPEVEVYVPRALRAALEKNKKAVAPEQETRLSKGERMVQEPCDPVTATQSSTTFSTGVSSLQADPTNMCAAANNHDAESESFHSPSSSPSHEGVISRPQENSDMSGAKHIGPIEQDTSVFTDVTSSKDNEQQLDGAYTFEFYDPAVVAFMPPSPNSPNSEITCENSNNSSLSAVDYHNSSVNCEQSSNCEADESSFHCQSQLEEETKSIEKSPIDLNVQSEPVPNLGSEVPEPAPSLNLTKNDSTHAVTSSPPSLMKHEFTQNGLCDSISEIASEKTTSPTVANLSCSVAYQNAEKVELKQEGSKTKSTEPAEEDAEDSWDTMFDDNGDCLDESLMEELVQNVGQVKIDQPKINYLKFEPKEPQIDTQAFSHIVEIYDFSPDLATCDLISAFREFASRGFDVKWVDDTHALGVFSSAVAASEALQMIHPLLKVRPMSQASKQGVNKARHCQEFLQPYKARPETTSIAARRLVAGALGMAPRVSREVRDKERQRLKEAKEKRRQEKQQKVDIWDGSFGKCAMDEET